MKILLLGQNKIFFECLNTVQKNQIINFFNIWGIITDKFGINYLKKKGWRTEFFNYEKIDFVDIENLINKNDIKAIISIQFPKIIPISLIRKIKFMAFNLHNAKLPDYRGHNSLTYEILNNEKKHTISVHWMAEKVDTGYIAMEKSINISQNETAFSLYNKCLKECPKVFLKFLRDLSTNSLKKKKIKGKGKYYSIVLNKKISNKESPKKIEAISRAFYFPGKEPAYFLIKKKKVYILPDKILKKNEAI